MGTVFAGGGRAIVATEAATDDGAMIHPRNRRPAAVAVTAFATVGTRDVAAVFAGSGGTIMTTGT